MYNPATGKTYLRLNQEVEETVVNIIKKLPWDILVV